MEAQVNPYQYQQAAIETQQARVETFMADNPTIDISTPSPPDPKVEIIPPGDNPTPPLEATDTPPATEHPTRRGFHETTLTGLAIAGAVGAVAINLVADTLEQEAYEQEQVRILKIKQELVTLKKAKEKQLENKNKTAIGKTTKEIKKTDTQATKPPIKSQIQAA